jgi:hypothetical protein
MRGASDVTLLQNSVTMTTTAELMGDALRVEVRIANDKTGHHVPTDFPLRHLILVVRATDAGGNLLTLTEGPALPEWTGDYAGQPGQAYAKILEDTWTGEAPTMAHWREVVVKADTRIPALATDISHYRFTVPANGPVTIETKLIYRRAFQQLMEWKGWAVPDVVMEEETVLVSPP